MRSNQPAAAHSQGMTNTRKKDVGQAGNGGQFAATNRPEAGVELVAPKHDLTLWDEADRAFPASLYEAGLRQP